MKKWVNFNCHTEEAERPKYRKGEDFYLGCHCEECGSTTKQSTLSKWIATLVSLARNDVKRVAFTLAEVLITLVIIGVIAALTIPNLMRKYEDHTQIAAVKTAYNLIANAIKMEIAENGQVTDWAWPNPTVTGRDADNQEFFAQALAKHLKVKKYCGTELGCFDHGNNIPGKLTYISAVSGGYVDTGYIMASVRLKQTATMVLENGMRIATSIARPTGNIKQDSIIIVDTNGIKGPNQFGYDVFVFSIKPEGLSPYGSWYSTWVSECNPTVSKQTHECSCSYWVFTKGNMDYKYRDVSAEW